MKKVKPVSGQHIFDKEAWAKMSREEQMGNIGSEVGRALRAKRQGEDSRMQSALYRGLDLMDVTIALWAERKDSGLAELVRAREIFVESILTAKVDWSLEKYFDHFALTARMHR